MDVCWHLWMGSMILPAKIRQNRCFPAQEANMTGAAEPNQEPLHKEMVGRHEIALPAGPLYGKIRLRAWSMFDILPTECLDLLE